MIARAQQAGVQQMIITGTTVEHSRSAIELDEQYPGVLYSTAGVHPHHAREFNHQTLDDLMMLAEHSSVCAIGECGLDFNRNFSTPEDQRRCFEAQLELAADLQMPVFLHQRDAHEDFLGILKRWRPRLSGRGGALLYWFNRGGSGLPGAGYVYRRHWLDL